MSPTLALQAYCTYCRQVYRIELLARPEQWLLRTGHMLLESDYELFVNAAAMVRVNRIITLRTLMNDLEWNTNRRLFWESEQPSAGRGVFKKLLSLIGV